MSVVQKMKKIVTVNSSRIFCVPGQRPRCRHMGHQTGSDAGAGGLDSRGSRQMVMQACPSGSLAAETNESEEMIL